MWKCHGYFPLLFFFLPQLLPLATRLFIILNVIKTLITHSSSFPSWLHRTLLCLFWSFVHTFMLTGKSFQKCFGNWELVCVCVCVCVCVWKAFSNQYFSITTDWNSKFWGHQVYRHSISVVKDCNCYPNNRTVEMFLKYYIHVQMPCPSLLEHYCNRSWCSNATTTKDTEATRQILVMCPISPSPHPPSKIKHKMGYFATQHKISRNRLQRHSSDLFGSPQAKSGTPTPARTP